MVELLAAAALIDQNSKVAGLTLDTEWDLATHRAPLLPIDGTLKLLDPTIKIHAIRAKHRIAVARRALPSTSQASDARTRYALPATRASQPTNWQSSSCGIRARIPAVRRWERTSFAGSIGRLRDSTSTDERTGSCMSAGAGGWRGRNSRSNHFLCVARLFRSRR
jgi:hypothetical protein